MESIAQLPIREIISKDYRSALVLRAVGIDLCREGDLTIQEACALKSMDPKEVLGQLEEASALPNGETPDFDGWTLSRIAHHIETRYHEPIRERIPLIREFLRRTVEVYGACEPKLKKIKDLFDQSAIELLAHLQREELIIFPFIRKIAASGQSKKLLLGPAFQNIRETIFALMKEHDREGDCLEEIRSLASNYIAPEYACSTYRVAFALLRDFEADMRQHINLEQNVLFPGAANLEHQAPKNRS